MPLFSAFEILLETLAPAGVLPPGIPNPTVLQGYWVQVSLVPNAPVQQALFNIVFCETTDFTQGPFGQASVQAQYIDPQGMANIYDQFFASTGRGFLNQRIAAGQTIIYGVQCIPPAGALEAPIPQGGTGWRGTVSIDVQGSTRGLLSATPTHRLLYFNPMTPQYPASIDEAVYAVPTASGTTITG